MSVERIYISPERGAPQTECDQITLVQGMGAVGDRNFGVTRYPGQNLTLIEAEEIERFCTEQGRASNQLPSTPARMSAPR